MCQANLGTLRGKLSCKKQYWQFDDPVKVVDSEEEIMNESAACVIRSNPESRYFQEIK